MNGEVDYLLKNCARLILLLRSASEVKRTELLDELEHSQAEINRVWREKTEN